MTLCRTVNPEATYKDYFIKTRKAASPPKSCDLQIKPSIIIVFQLVLKRVHASKELISLGEQVENVDQAKRQLERLFP